MLLDWLDEAKIERAGCFKYEPVNGARSNEMGLEQVPQEVKEARWHRFMQRQQKISANLLRKKVGKRAARHHRRGAWHTPPRAARNTTRRRSTARCTSSPRRPLRIGDIVTVKIDRADAYDLYGSAV